MIQQGFSIGERDWWVMVFYDMRTEAELNEVFRALLASGCESDKAQRACMLLSTWNCGYTFSNLSEHVSIMCIGKATSPQQTYNTIMHELKHLTEHISECYDLDPKEELSAYLQGEAGSIMFPAIALLTCPKCNSVTKDNIITY